MVKQKKKKGLNNALNIKKKKKKIKPWNVWIWDKSNEQCQLEKNPGMGYS